MCRRVETVEDIAWRGYRLRLWCFGCARWRDLDAGKVLQLFASKGWELDLAVARLRFPCSLCRSPQHVLILPASLPAPDPPAPPPEPSRERTWVDEVAAFFHGSRSKKKDRPLPKGTLEALSRLLKERGPEQRPDPRKRRIEDLG